MFLVDINILWLDIDILWLDIDILISSLKILISVLKISISSHKISISTRNIFLPYVMIDAMQIEVRQKYDFTKIGKYGCGDQDKY